MSTPDRAAVRTQHYVTVDIAVTCSVCGLLDVVGTVSAANDLAGNHEANHNGGRKGFGGE